MKNNKLLHRYVENYDILCARISHMPHENSALPRQSDYAFERLNTRDLLEPA